MIVQLLAYIAASNEKSTKISELAACNEETNNIAIVSLEENVNNTVSNEDQQDITELPQ